MNINAAILDKFDKKKNIYELILRQAERAHAVMNGAPSVVKPDNFNIHRLVMEEFLQPEETEKKEAEKKPPETT
jgi:DNA-directed RNA polymerase subunit K/omega